MERSNLEPRRRRAIPCVLSIAGSDSGGGAGIQADLKAFARCGVHGMTAITAVTWQNTLRVEGVTPIEPAAIVGQVKAVASDLGVDAVKIGMLGGEPTIAAVIEALELIPGVPVVLDPVMVAESGAPLLEPGAAVALTRDLLPRATVATPNYHEARALVEAAGLEAPAAAGELARAVQALGANAVVVTGGHGENGGAETGVESAEVTVDFFYDGERLEAIAGPRYPSGAAHGSGCTHSSALAAHLALGLEPLEAARAAKRLASEAVRDGLAELGAGPGPVDVFGLARSGSGLPTHR